MIKKTISIALAMVSTAGLSSAKELHVGAGHPLKTISAAAELAQPGDTIMVHEGIYREEVNPPRGGTSDAQRIVYTAAPGAKVVIKGSEPVKGWTRVANDTWKVTLPNTFFGDFNPYADLIRGDWFKPKGRTHHTGAVYIDESCLWFGEVDDKNTTIYAQFKDLDPNERDTEINVRKTVFYPREPGRDYITVRGFTMMHAATPWAPPTAEQFGLIGTHWSKGWIIENNTISHSKCVGITLGKYGDEWDNRSATATAYNDTIERALKNGWHKETVGSHVLRNNTVTHCEQAGIVGSLGCIFSTVEGNEFRHIHTHKLFSGAETAAIKFHAPIDMLIKDNLVSQSGGYGLLWLDWMAQGTRVSGNLFYNNLDPNVFMEVNHGPYLLDHNIFLGSDFKNWSQGGAYCYNILPGAITVSPQTRQTPYHRPHTTEVLGLSSIAGGDDRYLNNLMTQPDPFGSIQKNIKNMVVEGNQPLQSVKILEKDDGVYLSFELPKTEPAQPVTAERLGKTLVSQTTFANPDGTPMTLATDYFGKPRDPRHPGAGPFAGLKPGRHEIKVWPK
jgi:alpha-N-arabinofuranosidase